MSSNPRQIVKGLMAAAQIVKHLAPVAERIIDAARERREQPATCHDPLLHLLTLAPPPPSIPWTATPAG